MLYPRIPLWIPTAVLGGLGFIAYCAEVDPVRNRQRHVQAIKDIERQYPALAKQNNH